MDKRLRRWIVTMTQALPRVLLALLILVVVALVIMAATVWFELPGMVPLAG